MGIVEQQQRKIKMNNCRFKNPPLDCDVKIELKR